MAEEKATSTLNLTLNCTLWRVVLMSAPQVKLPAHFSQGIFFCDHKIFFFLCGLVET